MIHIIWNVNQLVVGKNIVERYHVTQDTRHWKSSVLRGNDSLQKKNPEKYIRLSETSLSCYAVVCTFVNTDESEDENEEDMFTELISQLQIDPDSMSELLSGQGELDLQLFSLKQNL